MKVVDNKAQQIYLVEIILRKLKYIHCIEIDHKVRMLIYALGVSGLLAHIIGTWRLSYAVGEIIQTFKGYVNLPCVLYSVAIFTFFRYHGNNKWMKSLIKYINPLMGTTLGIYLIHWYLLDWFSRNITEISPLSMTYRIFIGIVCFLVAAIFTKYSKSYQ